jgi:two-component system chemotaxis sensor kinase CheA
MDMSQYMEIFLEESKEHLQHMNQILLTLEKTPEDYQLINEIFRIAHTIKGMSGTMGYNKVATLTHEMENVLHLVRNKEIPVTSVIIDVIFECFDALENQITSIEANGVESSSDYTGLVNKLIQIINSKGSGTNKSGKTTKKSSGPAIIEEVETVVESNTSSEFNLEVAQAQEHVIMKANEMDLNAILVKVVLQDTCMLKAARAFIVFNTLEQFGEVIGSYPIAEEIEDEQFENSFEVLYITRLDEKTVENELMNISEIARVITELVIIGDKPLVDKEIDLSAINEEAEEDAFANADKAPKLDKKEGKEKNEKGKTAKTVRVDIDRLDNLMNLVSELIIIKTRLEDNGSTSSKQNMGEAIEYLERITTSLHDAVMKVRMVPVERTFNRFPRMVRDLSKDLGKSIKLLMSGEETEVDRTVIDEIGDPLIHLIRNSIDHGIESPEERSKAGKPEFGTVALRAYPDGNTVVIEVEDDGAGINPDKVLSKAISKGLLTQKEGEMLTQQEIGNLLFRPGFSTVDVITDLSGRGVGLDVVKTKIESLNGTVEIKSTLGQGSKFTIRLPLTLAIIQALMVNLNREKYALPLNNIKEITTIHSKSISLVQNQEVVLYRNKTLPLIRLNTVLQVPYHEDSKLNKEDLIVVVVKKGDVEAGLVVDSLIGQQEIVIKSLGKYLTGVKVIAGATILGNGGVALIVDPNQLF